MSACCRSLFFTLCALPAALAWAQPGESVAIMGHTPSVDDGAAAPPVPSSATATPLPRSALWQSIEAQRRQPAAEPWHVRRLSRDERALMRAQIRDYHGVRASAVSAAAVAPEAASAHPPAPVAR
ncbi:hypothetical protein EII20_05420 [Comamonadaceae bacterium OH2545_COT-014]|nr:hypothetical protein EII20_05420 [Comamonadaceae bacterium OH2545_COT-014]